MRKIVLLFISLLVLTFIVQGQETKRDIYSLSQQDLRFAGDEVPKITWYGERYPFQFYWNWINVDDLIFKTPDTRTTSFGWGIMDEMNDVLAYTLLDTLDHTNDTAKINWAFVMETRSGFFNAGMINKTGPGVTMPSVVMDVHDLDEDLNKLSVFTEPVEDRNYSRIINTNDELDLHDACSNSDSIFFICGNDLDKVNIPAEQVERYGLSSNRAFNLSHNFYALNKKDGEILGVFKTSDHKKEIDPFKTQGNTFSEVEGELYNNYQHYNTMTWVPELGKGVIGINQQNNEVRWLFADVFNNKIIETVGPDNYTMINNDYWWQNSNGIDLHDFDGTSGIIATLENGYAINGDPKNWREASVFVYRINMKDNTLELIHRLKHPETKHSTFGGATKFIELNGETFIWVEWGFKPLLFQSENPDPSPTIRASIFNLKTGELMADVRKDNYSAIRPVRWHPMEKLNCTYESVAPGKVKVTGEVSETGYYVWSNGSVTREPSLIVDVAIGEKITLQYKVPYMDNNEGWKLSNEILISGE